MKINVSSLMDGELDGHDVNQTLLSLRRDPEVRQHWDDAHLIGAVLRKDGDLSIDVSARVMAALEMEPTVVSPPSRRPSEWQRPLLAMAASAAGIALVAWVAIGTAVSPATDLTVAQAPATKGPDIAAASQVPSAARMQEYLVAHQAFAPSGNLGGGARHIRPVSAFREGRHE